jgi:hypothetical protein
LFHWYVCWCRFFYLYLPLGSLHQHFTLCLFCSENQSSSFLFFFFSFISSPSLYWAQPDVQPDTLQAGVKQPVSLLVPQ